MISNTDEMIDSRNVIERIVELEEMAERDDAEDRELYVLKNLAEEGAAYAVDWEFGEVMIHEDYFEQYARDLAEDLGTVSDRDQWPNYCIDWEKAADALLLDYTQMDFAGQNYYIR